VDIIDNNTVVTNNKVVISSNYLDNKERESRVAIGGKTLAMATCYAKIWQQAAKVMAKATSSATAVGHREGWCGACWGVSAIDDFG